MKLIKGEIYTATDGGERYIWRCDKDGRESTDFRLHINSWGIESIGKKVGSHRWNKHREPTYEERTWLEACIKADMLVPKPEINNNYEIY